MLVRKGPPGKPRADGGLFHAGEVDMASEILLSRMGKGILRAAMPPVTSQSPGGSPGKVVVGPLVAVVDNPPEPPGKERRHFGHPFVEHGADFGAISLRKPCPERGDEISPFRAQGTSHEFRMMRRGIPPDLALVPEAVFKEEQVDGKGIEQFVAKKDSDRGAGFPERGDHPNRRIGVRRKMALETFSKLFPWFDEAVFERFEQGRTKFPESGEDVPGELPVVPSLLDHDEGSPPCEARLPLARDAVGEEETKSFPHRDTRVEIPPAPNLSEAPSVSSARIVSVLGMIQSERHPIGKWHAPPGTF